MEQRISKIMRENDGKLFEVWQERGPKDREARSADPKSDKTNTAAKADKNFSYLYGGAGYEFRSSESSAEVQQSI